MSPPSLIRITHEPKLTPTQPFTEHFPNANIYELITPDLLHQLIKGVFKDHLVEWVCEYLEREHGKSKADSILDEIDRRYVINISPTGHLTDFLEEFH